MSELLVKWRSFESDGGEWFCHEKRPTPPGGCPSCIEARRRNDLEMTPADLDKQQHLREMLKAIEENAEKARQV